MCTHRHTHMQKNTHPEIYKHTHTSTLRDMTHIFIVGRIAQMHAHTHSERRRKMHSLTHINTHTHTHAHEYPHKSTHGTLTRKGRDTATKQEHMQQKVGVGEHLLPIHTQNACMLTRMETQRERERIPNNKHSTAQRTTPW